MKHDWAPNSGDLVWVTFDPQSGREQAGRRFALILSRSRRSHTEATANPNFTCKPLCQKGLRFAALFSSISYLFSVG